MKKSHKIGCLLFAALVLLVAGCARLPVREAPRLITEGMPEEAIRAFNSAEESFKEGRLDKAMALYGNMLERFPSGKVAFASHLRRGEILVARGQYGLAIGELGLLPGGFERDPLYAEARYNLARSHFGLGAFRTSQDIIEEILDRRVSPPLKPKVESLMGDILAQAGRSKEALGWYLKSFKSGPEAQLEGSVKKKAEKIITTLLSLEQLREMEKEYRRGYPSGHLLYALARASYRARDLDRAQGYLDRFLLDRRHPLRGEGEALLRRIAAAKLVNRNAIGCVIPLTGRYASYGNRVLDAIILASGVFDPGQDSPIELFIEDSKGDPATAREAVRRLADEHHVIGIVGPLGSSAALEAAGEAQELGVPIITLTQRQGITETGEYVFRDFLTGEAQTRALVSYSIHNLGVKNFAILHPGDHYGTEMMHLFWDEVLRQGGQIRGVETYTADQTDFGREIKSLTGLNLHEKGKGSGEDPKPIVDFDALFIPDSYSVVGMIAPQLVFYDAIGVHLLGTNIWNSPELLRKDSQYLEGAIFTDCFSLNSTRPEVRTFIDRFYVAWGREPGNVEALAYDATDILVRLIAGGGIEIRKDLRDAISRIENHPGITGATSFARGRDAQKSLHILMVVDNEIIQVR
ncbi:MAG: penicillin-binding protein activator [Deltaproteobacteria bacterium]|nr:penicillin-binding protein activator [Deltaproteobacteria bacterium]